LTDNTSKFSLADGTLARKLREAFGVNAGYNLLWRKHADGVIALRREPGRSTGLHATSDDLPIIAAALGYVQQNSEKAA
jgi:hypothetical protein